MAFAVTPQQASDLPDIAAGAAVGAAMHLAPPFRRELDDVIGLCLHGPVKVINCPAIDCDRTLTSVHPARFCAKTETCVDCLMTTQSNCCIVAEQLVRGTIMKHRIFFALFAVAFTVTAGAQESEISWKPTEVVPGIHMLEGQGGFAGGNISLVTGDDGVVLIDDGIEPVSAITVAAIESLTGDPVDFVINTHAHGDHIGANEAYRGKGATVVSHENLRTQMIKDGSSEAALPTLTFRDAVTFHLNGHTAYVFHVAKAHTDGDSVIHYPDVNVIHAGDVMFNKLFPFIDLDSGGSVDGYIAGQKKMLSLADDETKIIPGHGPLASKADLQAAVDMLEDANERVWALVIEGKSKEEVLAANPLADYHDDWNWGFITTERMTETLYRSWTE